MANSDICNTRNGLYMNNRCYTCPRYQFRPYQTPFITPSGPTCNTDIDIQNLQSSGGNIVDSRSLKSIKYNTPGDSPTMIVTPSSISTSCVNGELVNKGTISSPNFVCKLRTNITSCANGYMLTNKGTMTNPIYSCENDTPTVCPPSSSYVNIGTNVRSNYVCQKINCNNNGTLITSITPSGTESNICQTPAL